MRQLLLLFSAVLCLASVNVSPSFGQETVSIKRQASTPPCQTVWTDPGPNVVTPGIVSSPLADGYVMYTVRVQLHTPEDNQTECSVRQFRFNFPLLQSWLARGPQDVPMPVVQVTIESPSLEYSLTSTAIERIAENGFSAFILDGQTTGGYPSPYVYFADVSIVARPVPMK